MLLCFNCLSRNFSPTHNYFGNFPRAWRTQSIYWLRVSISGSGSSELGASVRVVSESQRVGNALSVHSGSLAWRLFLPWGESLKTEPFFGLNQTPGLFAHLNHAAVLLRGVLQIAQWWTHSQGGKAATWFHTSQHADTQVHTVKILQAFCGGRQKKKILAAGFRCIWCGGLWVKDTRRWCKNCFLTHDQCERHNCRWENTLTPFRIQLLCFRQQSTLESPLISLTHKPHNFLLSWGRLQICATTATPPPQTPPLYLPTTQTSDTTLVRVHTCFRGLHLIWAGSEKKKKGSKERGGTRSTSVHMSLKWINTGGILLQKPLMEIGSLAQQPFQQILLHVVADCGKNRATHIVHY